MDLPTYTNVWRIEKRLYKLYDLRLPMPLPLVTIGVYAGSFLPWIVLLQFFGVPFSAPWHVLYLVPPGVVAWLATRPVIEGKRLNELLQSQARYLSEPRTWCRLTPIREPREVVVVARVWRSPRQFTPSLDALTEVPAQARPQAPAAPTPATADAPQPLSEYAAEYAAAHQGAVARMQAQMNVQQVPAPEPAERMPIPVTPTLDSPAEPLRTESVPPGSVPPAEPVPAEAEPIEPVRAETAAEPEDEPAPAAPSRAEPPKRALISGIRRPGEELQYWRPAGAEADAAGTPTHAVRTTFDAAAIRQAAAAARAEEAARAAEAARAQRPPTPPRPQTPARSAETAPAEQPPRADETAGPRQSERNEDAARTGEAVRAEEEARTEAQEPARPEAGIRDEESVRPLDIDRTEDVARDEEPARSGDTERPGEAEHAEEPRAHEEVRQGDDAGRRLDGPSPSGEGDAVHAGGETPVGPPGSSGPVPEGDEAVVHEEHTPAEADEESAERPVVGQPPATMPDIPRVPGSFGAASTPPPRLREEERPQGDEAEQRPERESTPAAPAAQVSPVSSVANRTDQQIWPPVPAPGKLPPARVAPPPTTAPDIPQVTPSSAPQAPVPPASATPASGSAPAEGTPADPNRRERGEAPSGGHARPAAARGPQPSEETPSGREAPSGGREAPMAGPGPRPSERAPERRETTSGGHVVPMAGPGSRMPEDVPVERERREAPSGGYAVPAAGHEDERPGEPPGSFGGRGQRPRITAVEGDQGLGGRAPERSVWPGAPSRDRLPEPVRGRPVKPEPPRIVPPREELPPPPREVRSGPASPVRPRPTPVPAPPVERVQAITPPDQPMEEPGGLRRLLGRGNPVDQDYIERLQRPFQGKRHIVVLGCTGGAGQTVTTLMMGHTFAQYCGEPTVALDVNPGPGALARRTKIDTHETLTSLIANSEHIGSLSGIRRYTSRSKSGLDVVAAGKTPLHSLDDRDYAQAIRTLDRFYSVTLLDAAAGVVSRVLPHADQIVLVAPASADAPRAVAMTFEWLDGHGYHDLRQRAVTVINGVSRRSQGDVEQAEQVARGQCRALVRIPWDDHLSLDRSPRNELKALRPPTRRAYLALSAVVAGGFSVLPERYQDPSPYHQERTQ